MDADSFRTDVERVPVLLLGYSSIARRRILPALAAIGVTAVEVASESASAIECVHPLKVRLIRGYEAALQHSDARLVYVSTVNSRHFELAKRALEAGRHVIVDKPACLSVRDTECLAGIARERRLCLAEANVYAYHPRFQAALDMFRGGRERPTHLMAAFRFPPMHPHNFRYSRELGGGALWDLGPYAVTPARHILGESPSEWVCILTSHDDEVETAFSVVGVFSEGRAAVGSFGYTTAYINRLEITGPTLAVSMERVFTPPPDLPTTIEIRARDRRSTRDFEPADVFALFVSDVLRTIASGDATRFYASMLGDAMEIDRLRTSAGAGCGGSSSSTDGRLFGNARWSRP